MVTEMWRWALLSRSLPNHWLVISIITPFSNHFSKFIGFRPISPFTSDLSSQKSVINAKRSCICVRCFSFDFLLLWWNAVGQSEWFAWEEHKLLSKCHNLSRKQKYFFFLHLSFSFFHQNHRLVFIFGKFFVYQKSFHFKRK